MEQTAANSHRKPSQCPVAPCVSNEPGDFCGAAANTMLNCQDFEVDYLQYGVAAVPLPGALLMVAPGMLAIAAYRGEHQAGGQGSSRDIQSTPARPVSA